MGKKSKMEKLYEDHYRDMLNLNKRFIDTLRRPQLQNSNVPFSSILPARKLTKKQLEALARGRKKLASKRSKVIQI